MKGERELLFLSPGCMPRSTVVWVGADTYREASSKSVGWVYQKCLHPKDRETPEPDSRLVETEEV